jgi:uncharacterized protein YbjT (DUF2867 family)
VSAGPVLVVGGTGAVGQKVVESLLRRKKAVRALVRPGSDASRLEKQGVEIARGDMLDPASLERAMSGVDAVVTSAAGYTKRKKGDSERTDIEGNENLAEAAKNQRVRRFVLTSILNCHLTPDVPHFWHKKLAEDALEKRGVPFVALRPGAFLDQAVDAFAGMIKKRRLFAFGNADARWSYVFTPDLAESLAAAVDAPVKDGERIDIGWDRPVSARELGAISAGHVGERIAVHGIPWWLLGAGLGAAGVFNPAARDIKAMLRFFLSGQYVADTTRQREVLGPVPTAEDAIARWLRKNDLLSPASPSAADPS